MNSGAFGTLFKRLREEINRREVDNLASYAAFSTGGFRRQHDIQTAEGYRQSYSLDVDRILHSRAYTRYIDKTQVFYLIQNDHITHRVLHVQLVSKIARTIGRFLRLNEDLIEAIALGHDIGHTPFGHDGEAFLSQLCRDSGIGSFHHNIQSVQFLDKVERKGTGWNLCLQTLDGILCHDGEVHNQFLEPNPDKTFESLDRDMERKKQDPLYSFVPMTLEGCVVRMADVVGYIGRDLEDAIRLKMIRRTDIPGEIADLLGDTNGTIVYRLVTDIIEQSIGRSFITYSRAVAEALERLKQFNMERIYLDKKIKQQSDTIERLFELLFCQYLEDLRKGHTDSAIFRHFLKDMSPEYLARHSREEIVRDFIAGMTDRYFIAQCPDNMRPRPIE